MKSLFGFIFLIFIILAVIEIIRATILILVFGGLICCIVYCIGGLIYLNIIPIVHKLREIKNTCDKKKQLEIKQLERFEKGLPLAIWKDEKLFDSTAKKPVSICETFNS